MDDWLNFTGNSSYPEDVLLVISTAIPCMGIAKDQSPLLSNFLDSGTCNSVLLVSRNATFGNPYTQLKMRRNRRKGRSGEKETKKGTMAPSKNFMKIWLCP